MRPNPDRPANDAPSLSVCVRSLVIPNLAVVGEEFGTEDQAGAFYDAWWLTWQIVLMAGGLLAWGLVRVTSCNGPPRHV